MINPERNGNVIHLSLPSRLELLGVVDKIADGITEFIGFEDVDRDAVAISVIEACTNAIQHGHRGDATRPVELTVVNHADRVELRIRDDGEGFDIPEELPRFTNPTAECGRGLAIIQAVMDEVSVATDGATTVLSLVKRKGTR